MEKAGAELILKDIRVGICSAMNFMYVAFFSFIPQHISCIFLRDKYNSLIFWLEAIRFALDNTIRGKVKCVTYKENFSELLYG